MKKILYISVFTSVFFLISCHYMSVKRRQESVKRQKITVNQNCASFEGLNSVFGEQNLSMLDEPRSVTEKNFTKYILSGYPKGFPKTGLAFYIVFQPNLSPCCKRTVIADSLKMDAKQIDFLTDLILKYPGFNEMQFNKDEKVKYLLVLMAGDKKGGITMGLR